MTCLTCCSPQSSHDYLVYKYVLRYEPSPKRFPTQAYPIQVDIECRYPRFGLARNKFVFLANVSSRHLVSSEKLSRNHHVYQLSVQPTWKTEVVRKRLTGSLNKFQIELMDGLSINLCRLSLNSNFSKYNLHSLQCFI